MSTALSEARSRVVALLTGRSFASAHRCGVAPQADAAVLKRAVLEDAIGCLAGAHRGDVARAADARAWVKSRDRTWSFSFERVCEHLGLDPATIRRTVLEASARPGGRLLGSLRRIARMRSSRSASDRNRSA